MEFNEKNVAEFVYCLNYEGADFKPFIEAGISLGLVDSLDLIISLKR
jgi:hypothetical protein